MEDHLSHFPDPAPLPRILIAENNFSTFESLIDIIKRGRLACDFDFCTSLDNALWKLTSSSYQLVISGVHIAERQDCSLLMQTKTLETFVPMVVTAGAWEKESARCALSNGAFDLISSPIDHEQVVTTIRLALWQHQLLNLIGRRETALEGFRQHLDDYPGSRRLEAFSRAILLIGQVLSAYEETSHRVEETIKCIADLAKTVEAQTQERAFQRLDGLALT